MPSIDMYGGRSTRQQYKFQLREDRIGLQGPGQLCRTLGAAITLLKILFREGSVGLQGPS